MCSYMGNGVDSDSYMESGVDTDSYMGNGVDSDWCAVIWGVVWTVTVIWRVVLTVIGLQLYGEWCGQ